MKLKHLSWTLALLLVGATAPIGQVPAAQDRIVATLVDLDRGVGAPGRRAWMPITLTAAPGVKVGRLEITVAFPKALLDFSTLEASGLSEGVDADLQAEVRDDERDSSQKLLRVRLSTLDGKASRIPFPDGKLAYVLFQIAADAKPDSRIAVAASGTAVTVDNPPKPVDPFTVKVMPLDVSDEPLSSCFFYMH